MSPRFILLILLIFLLRSNIAVAQIKTRLQVDTEELDQLRKERQKQTIQSGHEIVADTLRNLSELDPKLRFQQDYQVGTSIYKSQLKNVDREKFNEVARLNQYKSYKVNQPKAPNSPNIGLESIDSLANTKGTLESDVNIEVLNTQVLNAVESVDLPAATTRNLDYSNNINEYRETFDDIPDEETLGNPNSIDKGIVKPLAYIPSDAINKLEAKGEKVKKQVDEESKVRTINYSPRNYAPDYMELILSVNQYGADQVTGVVGKEIAESGYVGAGPTVGLNEKHDFGLRTFVRYDVTKNLYSQAEMSNTIMEKKTAYSDAKSSVISKPTFNLGIGSVIWLGMQKEFGISYQVLYQLNGDSPGVFFRIGVARNTPKKI